CTAWVGAAGICRGGDGRGSRTGLWGGRAIGVMVCCNRYSRRGESRTKKEGILAAHDFLNPSRPKRGRSQMPIMLPPKAAPNQSQPCTLPDAMPLKSAPMLQPKERRAP